MKLYVDMQTAKAFERMGRKENLVCGFFWLMTKKN
jgi:hypothetical protein